MSDFYVPIDFSDLQYIIPSGEQIIYSTLCKCASVETSGTKTKITRWKSHVLFTNNGVAYKRAGSIKNRYIPWVDVHGMILIGGKGFMVNNIDFKLMRDPNLETNEQFIKRTREFLLKYPPLIIEKKERWLEEILATPGVKKHRIKKMKGSIFRLKANYDRILAKEQQAQAKEQKIQAKKEKKQAKKKK